MTGVSAIQYYSPIIFANMGIATDDTLKYQGISSIIALVAQFTTILCTYPYKSDCDVTNKKKLSTAPGVAGP